MPLLWYWCCLWLIILDVFIRRNVHVDWFTIFGIHHTVCNWICLQDINMLLVGPFFSFPCFQVGVCFLALCFCRFSPCVLVRNLATWVSSIVLIAGSTLLYVNIVKINGMYYLHIFRCWGLLVLCVVVDGFCLDVAFTSGRCECLHTTGLCFGRLVTKTLSVLYGGFQLRFQILGWV